MRIVIAFGLLTAALLLSSCGPAESTNPLFTEAERTFDPALLGAWESKDGSGVLKFETFADRAYKVTESDPKTQEQASYEARLARLGDGLFLDVLTLDPKVTPGSYRARMVSTENTMSFVPHILRVGDGVYLSLGAASFDSQRDLYDFRIVQAHWVVQAWKEGGDHLRLGLLDEEWVKKMLGERKASLGFERVGEDRKDVVLTASTKELQQFVIEHAQEPDAFPDPTEFRRKK